MKLFDARWKGTHGIGRFASELYGRLAGFRDLALGGSPAAPLDPLRLARHLRTVAPRLYFSPGYNAPVGAPCPFAFCLHDLNHLFVPENSSALKRAYYRYVVRPAIHRAEVVFTVSDFSRRAICEWSGVDARRVVNVGNGVSSVFCPEGPAFDRLGRPYFLHVGGHKPHKNLPRMLHAFARSGIQREFLFVCTGSPDTDLMRLAAQLDISDRLVFLGHASEELLASVYRGAVALVLVSTYEGFGLPIIEAMACGAPVITSSVASMPEIAGDAALLVEPTDIDAIGDAMSRIAADALLRDRLRGLGLLHARRFSWDESARRIRAELSTRLASDARCR